MQRLVIFRMIEHNESTGFFVMQLRVITSKACVVRCQQIGVYSMQY